MKYLDKFMDIYIWLAMAILMLLACVQHIDAGNTYTGFCMLFIGIVFLYMFKKNRFN